jgi:hypothetical protein
MLDQLLLRSTIHRMSDFAVAAAYVISRRYRMAAMSDAYAAVLASRLNVNNFTMIFMCALGKWHWDMSRARYGDLADLDESKSDQQGSNESSAPSKKPRAPIVHLTLCRSCLLFFRDHYSELLSAAGLYGGPSATALLFEVLGRVFFGTDESVDL